MSLPEAEATVQTFVVRVLADPAAGDALRGFVQHVRSGRESAFGDEADLVRMLSAVPPREAD